MPAGNLIVVENSTGAVIASGCKTVKQVDAAILKFLTDKAASTTEENIEASFSVLTPYKKFGDDGVKGYKIPTKDLKAGDKNE